MSRMLLLVSALSLLTMACATQNEGPFKRDDGWREGQIVELGNASALKKRASSDCRETLGTNPAATTSFATVAHRGLRMTHHRIVPVPMGIAPKQGDLVHVNLDVCANALVIRSAQ